MLGLGNVDLIFGPQLQAASHPFVQHSTSCLVVKLSLGALHLHNRAVERGNICAGHWMVYESGGMSFLRVIRVH